MDSSSYLLFVFALLLHNIEEALWLPGWSKNGGRFHREVAPHAFHFAVLIITILAFLASSLIILYPESDLFRFIYFGFLGAMMINVLFPHLAATIALRRYMPGLFTGLFLLLPVNMLIMVTAIRYQIIDWTRILIATAGMGIILLALLPVLFKLGGLIKDYGSTH